MRIPRLIAALLGISAYQQPLLPGSLSLDDAHVEKMRSSMGGQLQQPSRSQARWYLADLEAAEHEADAGSLERAALLMGAARKDGVLQGLLSTRTSGLVRLPKIFRGDREQVAALELGSNRVRSVFEEMLPSTELALLAGDGDLLGVGVGELVPVEGRDFPLLVRQSPQFLRYRWNENRWYYQSIAGLIPITPGDGRWILHCPGGRMAPWQNALWKAIGRAYIRKDHASLYKDNWEDKLANPARVAVSPHGASEMQSQRWYQQVMGWSKNTVFGVQPGYDVKLLESNGRGYESFKETIAEQNNEITLALAGQTVTVDGGAGFANADIHKTIRADLIKASADALAYTINTQAIPPFILDRWGEEGLENCACVEWDVTPPKDTAAEATALNAIGQALGVLQDNLAKQGRELDVDAFCARFNVPTRAVRKASVSLVRQDEKVAA